MVMDKNIKTTPVGKNEKLDIDVISLIQIVDKETDKTKTVVTNSEKIQGILSTDLDLGVVIKAENGGKPEQAR